MFLSLPVYPNRPSDERRGRFPHRERHRLETRNVRVQDSVMTEAASTSLPTNFPPLAVASHNHHCTITHNTPYLDRIRPLHHTRFSNAAETRQEGCCAGRACRGQDSSDQSYEIACAKDDAASRGADGSQ
jgi:hypothetical protein